MNKHVLRHGMLASAVGSLIGCAVRVLDAPYSGCGSTEARIFVLSESIDSSSSVHFSLLWWYLGFWFRSQLVSKF